MLYENACVVAQQLQESLCVVTTLSIGLVFKNDASVAVQLHWHWSNSNLTCRRQIARKRLCSDFVDWACSNKKVVCLTTLSIGLCRLDLL